MLTPEVSNAFINKDRVDYQHVGFFGHWMIAWKNGQAQAGFELGSSSSPHLRALTTRPSPPHCMNGVHLFNCFELFFTKLDLNFKLKILGWKCLLPRKLTFQLLNDSYHFCNQTLCCLLCWPLFLKSDFCTSLIFNVLWKFHGFLHFSCSIVVSLTLIDLR